MVQRSYHGVTLRVGEVEQGVQVRQQPVARFHHLSGRLANQITKCTGILWLQETQFIIKIHQLIDLTKV